MLPRWSLSAQRLALMDPCHAAGGRQVAWVSYSIREANSGLRFMKAIRRPGGYVHWQLRPVIDCMERKRPGWLLQRGVARGIGGHEEEFGLSTAYPWLIDSRRALQIQQRKTEADGGSHLALSLIHI